MSYYTKLIIPAVAAVSLSTAALAIVPPAAVADTSQLQVSDMRQSTVEKAPFSTLLAQKNSVDTLKNVTILPDGSIQASSLATISFPSVSIKSTPKPKPKPVVAVVAQATPAAPDAANPAGNPLAPVDPANPAGNPLAPVAATSSSYAAVAPADGSAMSKVVATAHQYLGVNYVWGGTSPVSGWDCSGFTQFAYAQAGISISRVNQWEGKQQVSYADALPGDLVVQNNQSHVGIYLGNGRMISALNPTQGTMEHSVDIMPATFFRVS